MARRGWRADPEATAAGVRKQALVPAGATVLEPVGTAPGLVVPPAEGRTGPTVLVLPGPPAELQGMWPAAVAAEPVQRALAGARRAAPGDRAALGHARGAAGRRPARARGRAGRAGDHHLPAGRRAGDRHPLRPGGAARLRPARRRCSPATTATRSSRPARRSTSWSRSGFADRGLTVATGGVLHRRAAGRPADRAARVVGLGARRGRPPTRTRPRSSCSACPADVLAEHGAVSPEVARRPGRGRPGAVRRRRRGRDHRHRRPGRRDGGEAGRHRAPVRRRARRAGELRALRLPGSRSAVRERSVTMAMHLLRVLLVGGPPA